jgi:hypothetical protein
VRKLIVKNLGGVIMLYLKLRKLFCLALCLSILFAAFYLGLFQAGKVYAMGLSGSSGGNPFQAGSPNAIPEAHPTPEPTTILLFSVGAAGIAAYKKYNKKK